MQRGTSTGQFILAGLWLLLSLYWYFVLNNVFVGTVWLLAAVIILILGFAKRKREKTEETKENE
jgi:hypothetical protein